MEKKFEWFLGIDVSKKTLDFTLLRNGIKTSYGQIENDTNALVEALKQLRKEHGVKFSQLLICAEHTGIYSAYVLNTAQQLKLNLWLESAVQIKQSLGIQRGKNDQVDSYRIGCYAYRFQDKAILWQPKREVISGLERLSALRSRLVNVRKQLVNALKEETGFTKEHIFKQLTAGCKNTLQALNKDIKKVEAELEKLLHSDEQLKRLYEVITSVTGIGPVTAVALIVATKEFKAFNDPRKFACYSGVAPFTHSSGSSIRGRTRTSKMANQGVKALLTMGARSAASYDAELKHYYERKISEGKSRHSVLNAIKAKLIHRVFACVNNNKLYEKKNVEENLVEA